MCKPPVFQGLIPLQDDASPSTTNLYFVSQCFANAWSSSRLSRLSIQKHSNYQHSPYYPPCLKGKEAKPHFCAALERCPHACETRLLTTIQPWSKKVYLLLRVNVWMSCAIFFSYFLLFLALYCTTRRIVPIISSVQHLNWARLSPFIESIHARQ